MHLSAGKCRNEDTGYEKNKKKHEVTFTMRALLSIIHPSDTTR